MANAIGWLAIALMAIMLGGTPDIADAIRDHISPPKCAK
jgi:hypothetical protein